MNPRDLIRIAKQLASGTVGGRRGRPRQTELRRAVSAAYYALFHALALSCANLLSGTDRSRPSWEQIYRGLEHGHARNQCNDQSGMTAFPVDIRYFGRRFVYTQGLRQHADYSPDASYSRRWVMQLIDETETALSSFENATNTDRRAFAIHVLVRRRRE